MTKLLKSVMLVLLALLSLPAHAYDVEIDGIYYNLENSGAQATATVTSGDNKYAGDVVIPESIVYDGVTYSVTSLGGSCFYGCRSLASIEIPSSVTSLGGWCFRDCSSLASIELPSSVTSLGDRCFSGCSSLASIEIPSSVTSVGECCFYGCSSLESIIVDAANPKYDSREWCNAIVETESNTMIAGCKDTKIPSSVTNLGYECFSGCSSLASIEIPSSVTSLGYECFSGCSSLASIEIPSSVTSLGYECFLGCSSLASIELPSSVTSLGRYCFYGCSSLESIVVDAANPKYDSREGCNAIVETESNTMIAGCKDTKIPSSVTSLGDLCFSYCSSLASIEIPSSVTSLGYGCFEDCSSLASIELPSSVTSLGEGCFWGCSSLTSIEIPSSVTSLGYGCFRDCSSLASIEIPSSVTTLGGYCFYGCSSLASIEIPSSVTSLGEHCFFDCSSLASIEIPSSVTSVGNWCFYGCSSFESIVVDAANPKYDSREGCNAIVETESNTMIAGCKNTKIPSSVTSLGWECFCGCSSLTSIEIPSSVTSLGWYCFEDCSSLTSIEIPSSVTSLGGYCFCGCSSLASIELPSSVTSLGDLCFAGCSSLASIELPSSVTSLGYACFSGCSSLASIEIPSSVTSLGNGCFSYCSGLTSVVSKIKEPFEFGSWCFNAIPSSCTLTVPHGTREAYMAAGWTESIFGGGIVEASLAADNYLTLSDAGACRGSGVLLPVDMRNSEAVTALQFELSLPTGVTLSDCLLTERKGNHTVSYSRLANGNYQVIVVSMNNRTFPGSEGALLELSLDVDGGVPSGDYPVLVKNIELTTPDAQAINPDEARATLTVSDVRPGDANGDGKISVTDVVAIANHILGKRTEGFRFAAADMNGDGKISITDAVAVVNKILEGGASARERGAAARLDPQ